MTDEDERRALRDRLVLAAVANAAFDGWGDAAIRAGARDVALDEPDAARLLPGGARELFRAFNDWADRQMAAAAAADALREQRLSERVQTLALARFELLEPYREAVRRGISFAALPQNAALGFSCFCRTVDRIWRLAGDRSSDFNYYTKRALLAGVLGSTALVWLDDRSEGRRITQDFLSRRLADVLRIQRVRARVGRVSGRFPDPFRILAGLGRPRRPTGPSI